MNQNGNFQKKLQDAYAQAKDSKMDKLSQTAEELVDLMKLKLLMRARLRITGVKVALLCRPEFYELSTENREKVIEMINSMLKEEQIQYECKKVAKDWEYRLWWVPKK